MARIDATEADRQAFKRTLEPLLASDGRKFDVVDWMAYFEALRDVPLPLLAQAVAVMTRERRRFPFRTGDVLEATERVRFELSAAHPWQPCDACRESSGFVQVVDDRGVPRLARCACFSEHQAAIAELGVPVRPLASLVAARMLTDGSDDGPEAA